jgi:hypothetical protein
MYYHVIRLNTSLRVTMPTVFLPYLIFVSFLLPVYIFDCYNYFILTIIFYLLIITLICYKLYMLFPLFKPICILILSYVCAITPDAIRFNN